MQTRLCLARPVLRLAAEEGAGAGAGEARPSRYEIDSVGGPAARSGAPGSVEDKGREATIAALHTAALLRTLGEE